MTGTERSSGAAHRSGDGGYVLLLTAIGAFFATMIARIVISPVVPDVIDTFAASRGTVGLALSGMWAGYALMQFASGVLGAKYGERPVMIASVGLTGISSGGLALSPSLPAFAVMAVVLGASAGLDFSASTALLTRRYENIGQVLGLHSTGGPLAGLVGPHEPSESVGKLETWSRWPPDTPAGG